MTILQWTRFGLVNVAIFFARFQYRYMFDAYTHHQHRFNIHAKNMVPFSENNHPILMNIYASYLYSCQTFSKEKNDARGSFSWWWRRRWEREKLLRTKADDGISNFLFCFVLELVWKLKRIASLFPGQSKTTTFGNFWRVHGSTHSTAEEMSPVKEKKYNFFVCVCVCLPIWL